MTVVRLTTASVLALACLGCATTAADREPSRARLADGEYLRSPANGYAGEWPADSKERVSTAFDDLLRNGSAPSARAAARSLIDRIGAFEPALLLLAQADFVAGDRDAARSRLEDWAQQATYDPATLLWARLAELDGDRIAAWEGYRRSAATSPLARRRALELEPAATTDLLRRVEQALASQRIDEARAMLEQLEAWSSGAPVTGVARWRVAAFSGDPQLELRVLRGVAAGSDDLDMRQRLAELELELGDAESGLRLYEALVRDDADNPARVEELARARFRWRLRLLPEEVLRIAESPQLTRAQYASLLYWLVPGVRNAASSSGRIATDILSIEAGQRQEIVRVLNRGLMDLDASGRRFEPHRSLLQREAWASLLELLAQSEPQPACVRTSSLSRRSSVESLCDTATACHLLGDEAGCLPEAPLSGRQAQDLIRRTLAVLSGN